MVADFTASCGWKEEDDLLCPSTIRAEFQTALLFWMEESSQPACAQTASLDQAQ